MKIGPLYILVHLDKYFFHGIYHKWWVHPQIARDFEKRGFYSGTCTCGYTVQAKIDDHESFQQRLEKQRNILKRLKERTASEEDYAAADNITRANYADLLWPDQPVEFRAHFMFHTDKNFNGFSDGKRGGTDRYKLNYCKYCKSS